LGERGGEHTPSRFQAVRGTISKGKKKAIHSVERNPWRRKKGSAYIGGLRRFLAEKKPLHQGKERDGEGRKKVNMPWSGPLQEDRRRKVARENNKQRGGEEKEKKERMGNRQWGRDK